MNLRRRLLLGVRVLLVPCMLYSCGLYRTRPSDYIEDEPLVSTRWRLLKLGREEVYRPEVAEKYVQFAHDSLSVRGFSGCNQFSGTYTVRQDSIRISQLATTRKLCMAEMATEDNFLQSLQRTNRFRIRGEVLKLYRGDTLLATFRGIRLK